MLSFTNKSSDYIAVQHDDKLSDDDIDPMESGSECGGDERNTEEQLNFMPENYIEHLSRGKIYATEEGVIIHG